VSRKRSLQASLAAALIGAALLVAPGSAIAAAASPAPGSIVWGPAPIPTSSAVNMCLDNPGGSMADGTQMDIYQCEDGATNQEWAVKVPTSGFDGGHYWIVNVKSGKCLTVKGNVSTVDEPIIQYSCNTGANEEWHVDFLSPLDQWVWAKSDGDCATVEAVGVTNKTPIIQYPCQGGDYPWENQRWDFY
jgi:hypothetical protein